MAKKKEPSITKTREITDSSTVTRSGERLPTVDELLGAKDVPPIATNMFMLKLKSPNRLDRILDELKVESAVPSDENVSIVLGSFSRSQIQALTDAKLLSRKDELLTPQSTWKSIHEVLSEIKNDKLLTDELTSTSSLTQSITETVSVQTVESSLGHAPAKAPVKVEPDTLVRRPISEKVAPAASPEITQVIKVLPRQMPASSSPWGWLALCGVLLGALVLWKFGANMKLPSREDDGQSAQMSAANNQDWPDYLRARDFSDLKPRAPLLSRIQPILEVYERGAKAVSENDLKMLKVLSGPGSSSIEARVVSTNMLAALALSRAQTDEAHRYLTKLLEVVPTDFTTLVNLSLVHLVARDTKEAKDVATTALRLCKTENCWIVRAVLGLIASEEARWVEAEENFKEALESSRGSLWVVGLWLRSLKNAPKDLARVRSTALLTESLVLDPDLGIDSPVHAPLATQILLTEVLRGFRTGMAIVPDALTDGQKRYIDWLLSRFELNPLVSSSTETLEKLKSETQALSQLAASYMEKELGNLDKSSELISRTISRLSGTTTKSSWPWSFAGDVQRSRGLTDQAVLFYETALSRNPRDVNAVFGLALILREKRNYKAAYQKMEEAASLDPNYVPAKLRRDRFEWERYWLSK